MKHLSLLLLLILTFAACKQKSRTVSYTETEREAVDSIVQSAKDLESARSMLNNYQQSSNILGQMAALRLMGRLYREDSQFLKAIECHQEELKLASQVNDTIEMIQALNNIGTNYRRLGSLEEAATNHQMAVLLSGSMEDQTSERSMKNRTVSLNGMGNVLMALKNYEHAENIFRQALEAERRLDSKRGMAINMANIGSIKRMVGQTDSAHYYFQQSLQMNEESGSQLGIGLCHIRFGELNEAEGQLDKAIEEYQAAYKILEKVGDDWHWMEAVLNIVQIDIKQGRTADAHKYLDMASQTVERIGSQDQQVRVYHLYYQLYEKTGNLRQALDNYILATELKDSLVNSTIVTNVQNQRMASEQLRQEHQLQQAEDQLALEQSQKTTIIVVAIAALLLALAGIMLMWLYIRNRAVKQHLAEQMQSDREDYFVSLAHDFQTPISVIINTGQQLEQKDITNETGVRSSAKMIVRQGKSLQDMINKILKKT